MKRIVNELGKLSWGKRVYAVVVLCATTAIALPAQTFTTLHSFDGTDGDQPWAGLVQASNGDLYGTTVAGGANGGGTVFKIAPNGTETTLYSLCAQGYPNCPDGYEPYAGLVQATNGELYGTTTYGGSRTNYPCDFFHGCGTVFKITPSGTLTTLYSFCSQNECPDGDWPTAGLVQATNGDLYGTNVGTVFKITPSGTLTTYICPQCIFPQAPLIQATNGDLYGASAAIFKITLDGTVTTLSSLSGDSFGGLVQAANGDFYGTTAYGGNDACPSGCGTIFKITPGGTLTTLYSFCSQSESGCPDGAEPYGGLVQATNGDFYGTTSSGGANDNCEGLNHPLPGCGTIFKITPSGTLTTLYSFCSQSGCTDGQDPYGGLSQDTNG